MAPNTLCGATSEGEVRGSLIGGGGISGDSDAFISPGWSEDDGEAGVWAGRGETKAGDDGCMPESG